MLNDQDCNHCFLAALLLFWNHVHELLLFLIVPFSEVGFPRTHSFNFGEFFGCSLSFTVACSFEIVLSTAPSSQNSFWSVLF